MLLGRTRTRTADVALDMTPMIDIVFNLLIFFLIASNFYQEDRQLPVALPFASSGESISSMLRELIVNVDAEGNVFLGTRPADSSELDRTIRAAVSTNAQQKVTVRGDRRTAYSNVVRVLDICKSAGIQEPYLDTVLTGSTP